MRFPSRSSWGAAGLLLIAALALRLSFHQGFFLGDNPFEWWMMKAILEHGPDYHQQAHLRFSIWMFNVLIQRLWGSTDKTFFLPIWLCSSSLSVIAYGILRNRGYRLLPALTAGLFVATAPFEIMMGTTWSNDLFLEWYWALCVMVLFWDDARPLIRGIGMGTLLWLAFYVKMWTAFFFPVLVLFLATDPRRGRKSMGLGFFGSTILLHSATCLFWKSRSGHFLPFIHFLPDTYPVSRQGLSATFLAYPKILFCGSDLHTTLFGWIPYLFVISVVMKSIAIWKAPRRFQWDRLDSMLIGGTCIFFLLLNFVPDNFRFDRYYSVFRIFRYLAPLSFPLTLTVAKFGIDLWKRVSFTPRRHWASAVIVLVVLTANLIQAAYATEPGRRFHRSTLTVLNELQVLQPPRVIGENWLLYLYENPYRNRLPPTTAFSDATGLPGHPNDVNTYERWISVHEAEWERGTVLITGLANYPNYGCLYCGPRLAFFQHPLSPRWTRYKALPDKDPMHEEPVELWILDPGGPSG